MNSHHVEDVGRILLQVQRDLQRIRSSIEASAPASDPAARELEHVLSQAEHDLRAKAEVVLYSVANHSVQKLPVFGTDGFMRPLIDERADVMTPEQLLAIRRAALIGPGGRLPSPTLEPLSASMAATMAARHAVAGGGLFDGGRGTGVGGVGGPVRFTGSVPPPPQSDSRRSMPYDSLREARVRRLVNMDVTGAVDGAPTSAAADAKGASRVRARVERARQLEYINNPTSEPAREFLRLRFGIPFTPAPVGRGPPPERGSAPQGKRAAGKQSHPGVTLPRANRIDPTLPPPSLDASAVEQGVINLVNRGFIPSNADLTPAFTVGDPPVKRVRAHIHDWAEQFVRPQVFLAPNGVSRAALRLDAAADVRALAGASVPTATAAGSSPVRPAAPSAPAPELPIVHVSSLEYAGPPPAVTSVSMRAGGVSASLHSPGGAAAAAGGADSPPALALRSGERPASLDGGGGDDLRASVEHIRGYNELLDAYSLHQFIIRKGRVLDSTPEFLSFKRTHASRWGPIVSVITALESLLAAFSVPIAYIDGQAVVALAGDELSAPTMPALLKCVTNAEQVAALVSLPGSRFKPDEAGRRAAATAIQATWRGRRVHQQYCAFLRFRAAAFRIQVAWAGYQRLQRTRAALRALRLEANARFAGVAEAFRARWEVLKGKRRVVVHIPSISRPEAQRRSMPYLALAQSQQLSRLCAVADPLVDVVYVSPLPLSDELLGYYHKLLAVGGVADAPSRLKVLVPENTERFPAHFSLTAQLLASPRCLKRLRQLLRGQEAYIVPGVVGHEDKRLAQVLGVPLLAPEPEVASVLNTKSGAKRVFVGADVNIPPGAHDIYEEDELYLTLSKLIAAYIDFPRWLFKIDDEFDGRGHAFFDVSHLPCVADLCVERDKFGGPGGDKAYWGRPDVQEAARNQIMHDLPQRVARHAVRCAPDVYPDWESFAAAFCRSGGVIEAVPADVRGSPSVNLFIEPNGVVSVTSTHEQLSSPLYRGLGCVFPQTSVPHTALAGASLAIGASLYAKGVIGYVSIDFVTFWDSVVDAQRLWAVDLNLCVSASAASFALFSFLMQGAFDAASTGTYCIDPRIREDATPGAGRASGGEPPSLPAAVWGGAATRAGGPSQWPLALPVERCEQRCYIMHPAVYHPHLAEMQYGAFFNLCRLKGISFDLQSRAGTAFMLVDALASGTIGLLSVGENPADAVRTGARALAFMQEQVGASHSTRSFFDSHLENFLDTVAVVRDLRRRIA